LLFSRAANRPFSSCRVTIGQRKGKGNAPVLIAFPFAALHGGDAAGQLVKESVEYRSGPQAARICRKSPFTGAEIIREVLRK